MGRDWVTCQGGAAALPGPTSSHRPQGPHPTAPQPRGLRCGGSGVGDMVWAVGMVLGGTGGAGGGQEVLGGTGGAEVAPLRTTGPLAWSCPRFAL